MLSPKTFGNIIKFIDDNYIYSYGELLKFLVLKDKKRWLRIVASDRNKELFLVYFDEDDI